jgi:transposase-like protein
MSKREHRRFTGEQTPEILREANQPDVTVSEMSRRHGLAASVFYIRSKKSRSSTAVRRQLVVANN